MSLVRAHKTDEKRLFGRLTDRRSRRSKHSNKFVTVVFGVGLTLVLTFLLWTFVMVFLQALEQWHK
jgi:hypothetical protein